MKLKSVIYFNSRNDETIGFDSDSVGSDIDSQLKEILKCKKSRKNKKDKKIKITIQKKRIQLSRMLISGE